MKENILIILRWIGVLPCAAAAYILGYGISKLAVWLNFSNADSWYQKFLIAGFSAGLGGSLFVMIPVLLVAPNNRKFVALTLVFLIIIFFCICLFSGEKIYAFTIVESVASVIGAVIGYFVSIDFEKANQHR